MILNISYLDVINIQVSYVSHMPIDILVMFKMQDLAF